jgi:hypothetical protein
MKHRPGGGSTNAALGRKLGRLSGKADRSKCLKSAIRFHLGSQRNKSKLSPKQEKGREKY